MATTSKYAHHSAAAITGRTRPPPRARPPHRLHSGVVGGVAVEQDVGRADDEVGRREQQRVIAECVRDRERDHEHRSHRDEHHQAHVVPLGVERVREPRVRHPRPPHDGEDQEPARERLPGRVLGDVGGDLRDRKDEDEVEEQLQRAHPLLGFPEVLAVLGVLDGLDQGLLLHRAG